MLLSLTEQQIKVIKDALYIVSEYYDDKAKACEENKEYRQSSDWNIRAFRCRAIQDDLPL